MTPFNRLVLRFAQPDRNTGNIEPWRPEFAKASRACGHEVMSYCYCRDYSTHDCAEDRTSVDHGTDFGVEERLSILGELSLR